MINPCNIVLLNCAANFIEMKSDSSVMLNLLSQTEKLLEGINNWTWSQLLLVLKKCQDLEHSNANSSPITRKVLDCLVQKLFLFNVASPYASSAETCSFKGNLSQTAYWWFQNLVFLNPNLIQKLVRVMLSQEVEHVTISKFLFYYQKFRAFGATQAEKRSIVEVTIDLLCFLDITSISFKCLFDIYRVAMNAKVGKKYINRLEIMIGSQLDQATIDNLLVPSPRGKNYSYDVGMVQRFVKAFLTEGGFHLVNPMIRLNKVFELMDLYLAEVAPDCYLHSSKFSALVMLLPDCARQTHDRLYRAIDMYLEVHPELCEEEKISVCRALNHEKLSAEALKHLARNSNFPSSTMMKAFISQDSRLGNFVHEIYHLKALSDPSLFCKVNKEIRGGKELDAYKQIIKKSNVKFSADFRGTDWKAMELDKVCEVPQSHATENIIRKSRISYAKSPRYLPTICSR